MSNNGRTKLPEYCVWLGMKKRCNPHYKRKHYAMRGITICNEWVNSFDQFYADMGKRPSPNHQLDRINNDGNYEPTNCRWVTRSFNVQRTHRSKLVTINGEEKSIRQLSEQYDISYSTLRERYNRGIRGEEILKSQRNKTSD